MTERPESRGGRDSGFRFAEPLERALGYVVGALLFAMMVVTLVDVVGRYGFNAPLPGAVEITELSMGILVFGALPLVTARTEHITISLFDFAIRGRARAIQNVLTNVVSAVVLAFFAWRIWLKGDELASYGDTSSYLGVPLAPFAYFMSVMSAATVVIVLLLIRRQVTAERREGV